LAQERLSFVILLFFKLTRIKTKCCVVIFGSLFPIASRRRFVHVFYLCL
jgi:hypothetical protein